MSKNQRLNASITIGSVLEQSVKQNIGFLKTGLGGVGDKIKNVERQQRELGKQRKVLVKQGQSVGELDRQYDKLELQLNDLKRAQDRWTKSAAASRRVGSAFKSVASDFTRHGRNIGVGLGLAGGAMFGLASSTAELGDNVAKTADQLGIGTQELQELRYAAERSGVGTTAFDGSLQKMTKNIGLALEGTGAQKDALDALGLSAGDLSTMLPEDALGIIADRMQGVATQAEKAAIANDIFGRSGISMLNMLRGGSKELRNLRDDAQRTGYVLSERAARDAEVFQDTLLDTQLTMKGLKNTVGAALLPVVTRSMRRIGDALVDNREDVEIWAERFALGAEELLPKLGAVASGIGDVSGKVWDGVDAVSEMVGGYENLGKIIAGVFAFKTVMKIGRFAIAIGSAATAMGTLAANTGLLGAAQNDIGLGKGLKKGGKLAAVGRFALKGGAIGAGVALGLGNMQMGDGTISPEVAAAGGPQIATQEQLLAGAKIPASERIKLGRTQEFNALPAPKAKAANALYAARVMNNLPTQESIKSLEADAVSARQEVEELKAQLSQISEGPLAQSIKAPMEMELKQRVKELNETEHELNATRQRAVDLTQALQALNESDVTPDIDTASLDQALGKARELMNTLNALEGAKTPSIALAGRSTPFRPQKNALGGAFHPGWHLTGELGPELKFENRSGYVANNRAMRQLASYTDNIGSAQPSPKGTQGLNERFAALQKGQPAKKERAQPTPQITQQITQHFHVTGVSADELLDIAERKSRSQAQSALYDLASPHSLGGV